MRLLVLVFLFLSLNLKAHEYHVTILNIEYNEDSSSFEVAIKLFTDDLNKVLKDDKGKPVYLGEDNQSTQADSVLGAYLLERFSIKVDSTYLPTDYLGFEQEEEFTWAYMECRKAIKTNLIYVYCAVLLEEVVSDHEHAQQSNLVNVKAYGQEKSLYLNKDRQAAWVMLKEW